MIPRGEVVNGEHDAVVVALVRHAGVPEPQVTEADAAFLDFGLHWRFHFGLLLDELFLDPAALLGGLLVLFFVGVVDAGPDLRAGLLVLIVASGESLRHYLLQSRRSSRPSLASTYSPQSQTVSPGTCG